DQHPPIQQPRRREEEPTSAHAPSRRPGASGRVVEFGAGKNSRTATIIKVECCAAATGDEHPPIQQPRRRMAEPTNAHAPSHRPGASDRVVEFGAGEERGTIKTEECPAA